MIIDTHTHLDDEQYSEDLEQVYERAHKENVHAFIIPGADPKDYSRAKKIAHSHKNTFLASAVHPYHIDDFCAKSVEENAKDDLCVAIGECGLDYFRSKEQKKEQAKCFVEQIDIANRLDLPLIVHSRDANADTFEILRSHPSRGVLHCFNASELLLGLEDDFYFGIGGVLTFKNAKELPQILKKIPLERILIETDAPYLAPVPHRGKRNESAHTRLVVEKIASLLDKTQAQIEQITTQNAIECFRLKLDYQK